MPTLYLIPSALSDAPLTEVLPDLNMQIVTQIKHYIVENVRSARRFLRRCSRDIDIDSLTFSVLNVDTDPADVAAMLAPMAEGHDMGVISEAGCPAVADPGALAVACAHRHGYRVTPLVGPSSILMALMASGFNGQSFTFNGYLPIDNSARIETIKRLHRDSVKHRCTQIFIETPYRNNRMIADIIASLPADAHLCVAADITAPEASIITLPIAEWRKRKVDYDKHPAIFLIYK